MTHIGVAADKAIRVGWLQCVLQHFVAGNGCIEIRSGFVRRLINGEVLTESVAILSWLHRTYPDGKLFPYAANDLDAVNQIGDLAFFSGTIHPFISRFARPEKFVNDKNVRGQVSGAAAEAVKLYWTQINDRLAMPLGGMANSGQMLMVICFGPGGEWA